MMLKRNPSDNQNVSYHKLQVHHPPPPPPSISRCNSHKLQEEPLSTLAMLYMEISTSQV